MQALLKTPVFVAVSVVTILIALSIVWYAGEKNGIYNPENEIYIPHYLGDRPVLEKLFDSYSTSSGYFRGRELSHFFNYLDVQFILLSFRLGHPHFLSVFHFIALALIAFFHLFMVIRFLPPDRRYPFLILFLIFLFSPSPFLTGWCFRTSKIMAALGIVVLGWGLWWAARQVNREIVDRKTLILTSLFFFFISVFMGFVDEQALAFVLMYGAFTWLCFFSDHRYSFMRIPGWAIAAGVAVVFVYRQLIGTWLVFKITGRYPKPMGLDTNYIFNWHNLDDGFLMIIRYFGEEFGNLLFSLSFALIMIFLLIFAKKVNVGPQENSRSPKPGQIAKFSNFLIRPEVLFFVTFASIVVYVHLMAMNNAGSKTGPYEAGGVESTKVYYPLPLAGFFFFVAALAVDKAMSLIRMKWIVPAILVVMLGLNLFAIDGHNRVLKSQPYFGPQYHQAQKIIQEVFELKDPDAESKLIPPFQGKNTSRAIRAKLFKKNI